MSENAEPAAFNIRVRHYADILNLLFDFQPHQEIHRFFEFVCTLVRSSGIQDADWDPWHESQATLSDLTSLASLELPQERFPDATRTRMRLSLLSYSHITEMDLPYSLIANLLRLRIGKKYDMDPFRDLGRPVPKKKRHLFGKIIPPSPGAKILRIKQLSGQAHLPEVGSAVESIYDNEIRNAVYHSDYTLTDREFRIVAGTRLSRKRNCFTPVVEIDELNELFVNAFAFYSALFALYERCRKSFGDFKNAFLPYDGHYKGVLQLLFDEEDRLMGYRVYWPNQTVGEYRRGRSGCGGSNFTFDPDGSINFFVGLYASNPGAFSPLVESNAEPSYALVPGTTLRPHWPEDLRPYKLPI